MGIFGAAIKGFGKALKNKKVKDKISKSAKDFVAIQKKKNKGKPDFVKQSGPSKTQVVGFGAAAGAGAGALATIKKNKPVKKAMGGEAGESLRKGQIFKEKRDKRRNEVDEMIERLYGPGIKPKKKPKNLDKIRPKTKPKKPQESIMPPKTRYSRNKVTAKQLAKSRKPTGRINKDDIANAVATLKMLTPSEKAKLKNEIKRMGTLPSSDALKAAAAQLKREQRKFTAAGRQSKGPVGTKLKKVSKLKF